MLFLIDYDRERGEIVELREFDESDRSKAEAQRLDLELSLVVRRITREVVLLQAPNLAALHNTHRRYFATLGELSTPRGMP